MSGKTLLASVACALFASTKAGYVATGTFDETETGVTGYVKVTAGGLMISIDISAVDSSIFSDGATCYENGFSYHIHEYWTGYNDTETSSLMCGPDYTGGHWDPWLGCGGATGNDYCTAEEDVDGAPACVAGSSVLDGTYDCSTTTFAENPYACEVGDWSGKYGKLMITDNVGTASVSSPYEVEPADLEGYSVVFHCSSTGGQRVFCAEFEITEEADDTTRATQSGNPSLTAAVDSSNYLKLNNDGTYMVAMNIGDIDADSTCTELAYRIYESCETDAALYDPTATCLMGSANEACTGTKLCNDTDFTYMCDASGYGDDRFLCSPSDLSGKYGTITTTTTSISGTDAIMVDLSLVEGMGVKLLCASDNYAELGCATLTETSDSTDTSDSSTDTPVTSTADDDDAGDSSTDTPVTSTADTPVTSTADDDDAGNVEDAAFGLTAQFASVVFILATLLQMMF